MSTIKTAEFQIDRASVRPAKDGNFYINCSPVNTADHIINPTGRFGFSKDQLISLAANHGMPDYNQLLSAINRKDSTMMVVAEHCVVGEEYTDQQGNTRKYGFNADGTPKDDAADWWKVDSLQTDISLGRLGQAYVNHIETAIQTQRGLAAYDEISAQADVNRKRMLENAAKSSGKSVNDLLTGGGQKSLPDPADIDTTAGAKDKPKAKAKA